MARERTYTDAELAIAIAEATSWRGTLRKLGIAATSAAQMRSVRLRADALGLDHGHFTGQRRWSDRALADAVQASSSFAEVADRLGLAGGSSTSTIRGHAVRLGLDTSHFSRAGHHASAAVALSASLTRLPQAGALLAAAWFTLAGCAVSWPLEPARYDLLVELESRLHRVQVKTTTYARDGSWIVRLSTAGRTHLTYDPDEIDSFVVLDGDLAIYLIPSAAVGGLQDLRLAAYTRYIVGRLPALAPT